MKFIFRLFKFSIHQKYKKEDKSAINLDDIYIGTDEEMNYI